MCRLEGVGICARSLPATSATSRLLNIEEEKKREVWREKRNEIAKVPNMNPNMKNGRFFIIDNVWSFFSLRHATPLLLIML